MTDETEHNEVNEDESPPPEELQARIAELAQELAETEDRYLRAVAELRNYRQRAAEQQAQQLQYANQKLLTALLPVLDHIELALQSARSKEQSPEEVLTGVEKTYRQLGEVLAQFGLTRLATAGEQFDPKLHEAVERRLIPDEAVEGEIVEELRPGYKLHDRLVRPAEVCVGVRETPSNSKLLREESGKIKTQTGIDRADGEKV